MDWISKAASSSKNKSMHNGLKLHKRQKFGGVVRMTNVAKFKQSASMGFWLLWWVYVTGLVGEWRPSLEPAQEVEFLPGVYGKQLTYAGNEKSKEPKTLFMEAILLCQ